MTAVVQNTTFSSSFGTTTLALPLGAYFADSSGSANLSTLDHQPSLDAATLLRELIARAGVLPDVAPGGDRFVLVALPPYLLEALAAQLPPALQPMPLLEWRA